MVVTTDQLRSIAPFSTGKVDLFIDPINTALINQQINTAIRAAAFLAQVMHESGQLRYVAEIADGSAYEGRADLGNNQPGDGPRFKGRGLLQITGRSAYKACGIALHLDLINNPSLLETPGPAAASAGWFWRIKGLNTLADLNQFGAITRVINGGFNGLDDRIEYWLKARKVLGL